MFGVNLERASSCCFRAGEAVSVFDMTLSGLVGNRHTEFSPAFGIIRIDRQGPEDGLPRPVELTARVLDDGGREPAVVGIRGELDGARRGLTRIKSPGISSS